MLASALPVDEFVDVRRTIDYRVASTFEERCAALRLIYRAYIQAGLGKPNRYAMRVTPYHLLSTTQMFVAAVDDEVFFTMTLVVDGELGLPMEAIYAEEVMERRLQGRTLAEVSCLADRRSGCRGFYPAFLGVSRYVAQFARLHGVDDLVIAVHPKHARFYRRLLGFRTFGELKAYPTVRNHPAVALVMDLAGLEGDHPKAYQLLFGERLPDWELVPQPISEDECSTLRPMIDPAFHCAPLHEEDAEGPCDGRLALAR